ncbi:hypothetical protein [Vibrio olivae]|uniref:Uncharacterized protein n=1 Tax=Vibrio olivae TaxID=1243002 RepID=A0ABV5HR15_9VIBR
MLKEQNFALNDIQASLESDMLRFSLDVNGKVTSINTNVTQELGLVDSMSQGRS